MRVELVLCLPRDDSTVPVLRHIAACALRELGVVPDVIDDVALALTEACANVVRHSGVDDEYEVRLSVEDQWCEISVVDTGHGFDSSSLAVAMAGSAEEQGRGLALMQALVDDVRFESRPEAGTVVHLVKQIPLLADGPLRRFSRSDQS